MIVFIYYWRFERGMIKKLFLISRSKLHVRIGVDQNYLNKGYGWMCKSCRRVENKSEIGIDRFWKGRERRRRMYRGLPRATHARAFHASDATSSFAKAPKAGVGPSDISAMTDNTMALIRRTVKRVKRYPRPRRRWMAGPERVVGLHLSYRISFELRRIEQLFDSGAHCSFDPLSLSSRDPDLLLWSYRLSSIFIVCLS